MKTILVIEDDINLTNLLKHHFALELNLDFVFTSSYVQGLAAIEQKKFDLYLIDLMLDGHHGLDLIRRLQKEGNMDNRIIIISADARDEARINGYNLGAANYVQKPINFELLRAIMKNNLRIFAHSNREELNFGNILIAPQLHACFLKTNHTEIEVKLTLTEFNILYRLCQSPNIVVAKDELCFFGKDHSNPMSSKALEMHIASIRKKLGQHQYIDSRRGVGYLFCPTPLTKPNSSQIAG